MLGISVYFQDLDEQYIKTCAQIGIQYVFTSLHIPEEDYSQLDKKLPQFILLCQDLGLKIVPDVSPVTFEKLNLKLGDFSALKQMGIQALRSVSYTHLLKMMLLEKLLKKGYKK